MRSYNGTIRHEAQALTGGHGQSVAVSIGDRYGLCRRDMQDDTVFERLVSNRGAGKKRAQRGSQ
jgi:hypothetical protein